MKRLLITHITALLACLLSTFSLLAQRSADDFFFRRQVQEQLVLLRNEQGRLPILDLSGEKICVLSLGERGPSTLQQTLKYYADCEWISIPYGDLDGPQKLSRLLQEKKRLVLSWHRPSEWDSLPPGVIAAWQEAVGSQIVAYGTAVVVVVAEASSLRRFPSLEKAGHLLLTGGELPTYESLAAQVIMGAEACTGRLVEDVSTFFLRGNGLRLGGGLRLRYSHPEAVNWSGEDLSRRIDSIVYAGIKARAFPGCQVLVAKDHQVIFHKTYGFHTYDSLRPVNEFDLYDLASVTKVTGPLPILMKLHDDAVIGLDVPMASYWPDFFASDKGRITLREVLAHQAGLKPYIRFYEQTQRPNGKFRGRTVSADSSESYSMKVTEEMYLHRRWEKVILKGIRDTALLPVGEYRYSDLSFMVFPDMIRMLTRQPYEAYLRKEFLDPLGAGRMGFLPLRWASLAEIVPTEYDAVFRQGLVHGYVHDENAAMRGGISGHAGLFANYHDVAKIFQMYLNGGTYGGRQFLSRETLNTFTSYQFEGNRRGLGFDKPPRKGMEASYVSPRVSEKSFGHSGYTGTFVWADPATGLLLVFLSNRVYPSREQQGLSEMKIREALQEVLYTPKEAVWRR